MRLLLVLSLLLVSSTAGADQAKRVVVQDFAVSGTAITALAKAAGSAATLTDAILVSSSEDHSVMSTITCTQAVSVVITLQGSVDDGTTWCAFNPAITITRIATATPRLDPISVPVTMLIRASIASDATYPVTISALKLARQ